MMNTIPTDAEMTFWIVLLVIAVLFFIALPFIRNAIEQSEVDRMFRRPDTNVDDMEDRWD